MLSNKVKRERGKGETKGETECGSGRREIEREGDRGREKNRVSERFLL